MDGVPETDDEGCKTPTGTPDRLDFGDVPPPATASAGATPHFPRRAPYPAREGLARGPEGVKWTPGHARSASHVGILRIPSGHEVSKEQGFHADSGNVSGAGMPPRIKGHQRAFSHGQMTEGKGHRREGSRTDFILPEGHEERERERELRKPKTSSAKRPSLKRKGHSREASRTESVYTIRDQKRSLLQRFFFWKRHSSESCSRLVVPNHVIPSDGLSSAHPNSRYPGNKICTAKYTLLSFLPKNLLEQFHRFANLYFLAIVLLNFVPSVNAFAKELAVIPLIFVLGVTAVKDAFEDHRRHRSDARVNKRTCMVYSSLRGCYTSTPWEKVSVGDVVRLSCNETIPADMVLLNTSDEQGVCHIESSNLDGETNLKQRQSIRGIGMDVSGFEVSRFDSPLEVGPPTTKMYHFVGSIPIGEGKCVPLSNDNLLLRDCVIKNVTYVEGIVVYAGRETKALLNNGGTRYKRSRLERMMNHEVVWCVLILFLMAVFSATGSSLWQRSYTKSGLSPFMSPLTFMQSPPGGGNAPPDGGNEPESHGFLRVGFVSFWTFIIIYQVLIPISLYVTIEIIKMVQVYLIQCDPHFVNKKTQNTINCRALNITEELGQVEHVFTDKTGTLTENEMVFQRCSINGTDYDHVSSVTKDERGTSRETFIPNSQLQEELQAVKLQYLYVQHPVGAGCGRRAVGRLGSSPHCKDTQRLLDFFFTLAACNTVVVAKEPRTEQVIQNPSPDPPMTGSDPGFLGPQRGPFLRSVLGSLSPIASSPSTSPESSPSRPKTPPSFLPKRGSPFYPRNRRRTPQPDQVPEITLNTFMGTPENGPGGIPRPATLPLESLGTTQKRGVSPCGGRPIYEAESPDELALVDAALRYGCRLVRRDLRSVVVALPGCGEKEYEVLNVLPFDSDRKRMSIIVRHPDTGDKILYCKGADSAVLGNLTRRCDEAEQIRREKTEHHLQEFSQKGLRVLCTAKRVLSDTQYEEWATQHRQSEATLANRDQKLSESYARVETELQLTGATGIEDRLQDFVPETIDALQQAGIKVWVLTGDKQETAINIAFAAALFTPQMEILCLNAHTKEQTERSLAMYLQQTEERLKSHHQRHRQPLFFSKLRDSVDSSFAEPSSRSRHTLRKLGLVVDGKTLVYILDRRANLKGAFLRLAAHCSAVMCCRVNPLQKALMVRVAKEKLKALTLAVGDGANDVSMIQTADVGVGISGVEGRQAVMASDFAVTRFHHLKKLLLVHGHWCYDRLARIILYFFYKNTSFVFLLMWYQLFCGFSTAVMIDDLYLVMFNLIFTSLPPMSVGIYDKDAPESLLMAHPNLYAKTRLGTVYTSKAFWVNIIDAIYQSIVIFFVGAVSYFNTDGGVYEFGMTITHGCLLTQLLHIAIETKSWTIIHLGSLLCSYFLFFAFGVLYTVTCNGCIGLPSLFGELAHMVLSPIHWCCVVISVVLSLMPRFLIRVLQATFWPDDLTRFLLELKQKGHSNFSNDDSPTSSEPSSVCSPPKEERLPRPATALDEDASDGMSSLVSMTTIVSTIEEADA